MQQLKQIMIIRDSLCMLQQSYAALLSKAGHRCLI